MGGGGGGGMYNGDITISLKQHKILREKEELLANKISYFSLFFFFQKVSFLGVINTQDCLVKNFNPFPKKQIVGSSQTERNSRWQFQILWKW